ncbi:sugar transferase [Consotaella salsifontis]|uniref:Sugar transferase involved in LPS biosynthesis (Colanic, teichoic acid) n=1 Tax=Consotaella salsifontis TaxID=1365950 RepID=A0A1T4P7K4_9HYPH|nr:sugar transferase [Consotaella salsifontis]SJZ86878.1 Sugar transferase involved in LPS biosynthesis (colanic, teichoic acid) [Consotaella salsifontis]
MKRTFDLVLALLLLPFALPIVLVLAAVIRSTTAGPAIFRQVRVGREGRPFVCLKLRTMRTDTLNAPSHEVGSSGVTSVGRVLRRTKLDELPQLWNILLGEMSFVGPRPCLPSQTELIEARRAYGLDAIRPGITGVSQVKGVDMSNPARLAALDATYLDNMSLTNDLRLMALTVFGAGRGDRLNASR